MCFIPAAMYCISRIRIRLAAKPAESCAWSTTTGSASATRALCSSSSCDLTADIHLRCRQEDNDHRLPVAVRCGCRCLPPRLLRYLRRRHSAQGAKLDTATLAYPATPLLSAFESLFFSGIDRPLHRLYSILSPHTTHTTHIPLHLLAPVAGPTAALRNTAASTPYFTTQHDRDLPSPRDPRNPPSH